MGILENVNKTRKSRKIVKIMAENDKPIVIEPDSESSDGEEFSDAIAESSEPNKNEDQDEFFDVDWRENKSESGDEDKDEHLNEESENDLKEQKLKERLEHEASMTDEEKSAKKSQALDLKKQGNEFYLAGDNLEAIRAYDEALEICPLYFKEDRAILLSNKAAALIKNDEKEKAIEECTNALELNPNYMKALLRRAQTYEDTDKPHEAMKDFEKVLEFDPAHKDARMAVMRLPEKIKAKDEKLKEEMMSNLKNLGNMVLKPFGLSTNNFSMVQDPNTGGYNIQFKQ